MKAFRKLGMAVCLVVVFLGVSLGIADEAKNVQLCKGIVLLIGDGMGVNQVRSADIYAKDILGKDIVLNTIRTRGITATNSAQSHVTDSAAAATALYSGYKTDNRRLNVLRDCRQVFTIGHAAKKAGLSVGVVSTTRLTHATPAGVFCHTSDRDDENCIAEQLVEFEPEVAMAGGRRHFIPQSEKGSKRKDQDNLIEKMKEKGYRYVTDREGLKRMDPASTKRLLGLFSRSHMAYELDRLNVPKLKAQPTLADMTEAALAILSKNPKGFFLMVEGGRIDHACHAHDIKASIYDTLAFDDAVRAALDFRKTHPDVLVLVTADHETGGLGLGRGAEYAIDLNALKPIKNSLEYINKRTQKDPAKLEEVLSAAGYKLTDAEKKLLAEHPIAVKSHDVPELKGMAKVDEYMGTWLHYALSKIETERGKIGWTSVAHTAQPVVTYAAGPGEEEFAGFYDNTEIAKRMCKVLGVTPEQPAAFQAAAPCVKCVQGASR